MKVYILLLCCVSKNELPCKYKWAILNMEIINSILVCVKEINFVSDERQGSVLCNYHLNKNQKSILFFMDHTKNLRVHSKRTLKSVINGTVKKFLRSKDLSKIII